MLVARARVALALFAMTLAASGAALADPPTRAQVQAALGGFEQAPGAELVRGWGPEGARLLMELGNDPRSELQVRLRAVYSLRHFAQQPAVLTYLRAFAAVSAQPVLLRRAAFDALAQGFADVPTLALYVHAPEAEVRDGVAWALRAINSAEARAVLTDAMRTETDATVRITIAGALQQQH